MSEPATIEDFAAELKISDAALAKLRRKHKTDKALHGYLRAQWKLANPEPRYLAAQNGYRSPKNYTTSPYFAIDDLSAVPEEYQRALSKERREHFNANRKQERLEAEQRSLEARIGIAKKVAEIRNIDITRELWAMEKKLKTLEKRLYEKEAA